MVAFGKLQELITGSPVTMPGQKVVNAALFLLVIVAGGVAVWRRATRTRACWC